MKKLSTLIFIAAAIFSFQGNAYAQFRCGFDPAMMSQMKAHPRYARDIAKADSLWTARQNELMHTSRRLTIEGGDTVYEIPTVIHVLTTGGAIGTIYNPADTTLENWINYLNEVYAGTYASYPQAGSGGVALPVKFVLAKRDPNCDSTTGIERIDLSGNATYVSYGIQSSTSNGLTTDQVSTYQWPADAYYNMYIVNKIDGVDGNCAPCTYTAGFAYLGLSTIIPDDGAYMLAKTAQAGDITLPHEIGHALGLYHVFEGTTTTACPPSTGNCNNDNDKVCDTDPSGVLLGTCPSGTTTNPCTTLQYGSNGVQHNFMNYSQCQNHFTQGQADRMMLMLQTYRSALITSNGALPPPAASQAPIAATCQSASMTNTAVSSNVGPCNISLDSIQYYSNGYLTYSGTDDSFYLDHTQQCALATHTSLIAGDTYHLSVSTQLNGQYVKAFIDYNNDGTFSPASETVMSVNSNIGDTTYTVAIVPPATATTNTPLRMRIIADFGNSSITPCGSLNYGQAEDFSVTILPNTPLNLGLIGFSGKPIAANQALLSWQVSTAPEGINAFELQRSSDGRNFTTIAFINRKTNLSDYYYTDFVNIDQAEYFYRLKLVCNSAEPIFSKVVALNFGNISKQQIKIFPNPVSSQLRIKSQNALSAINIYDAMGRNIIHQSFSSLKKEQDIDMSGLAPGTYLVQALDNGGLQTKQKITKE